MSHQYPVLHCVQKQKSGAHIDSSTHNSLMWCQLNEAHPKLLGGLARRVLTGVKAGNSGTHRSIDHQ